MSKTLFHPLDLTQAEAESLLLTETAAGHVGWVDDIFLGPGVCQGCMADFRAFVKGWKPSLRPAQHGRAVTVEEMRDYLEDL